MLSTDGYTVTDHRTRIESIFLDRPRVVVERTFDSLYDSRTRSQQEAGTTDRRPKSGSPVKVTTTTASTPSSSRMSPRGSAIARSEPTIRRGRRVRVGVRLMPRPAINPGRIGTKACDLTVARGKRFARRSRGTEGDQRHKGRRDGDRAAARTKGRS